MNYQAVVCLFTHVKKRALLPFESFKLLMSDMLLPSILNWSCQFSVLCINILHFLNITILSIIQPENILCRVRKPIYRDLHNKRLAYNYKTYKKSCMEVIALKNRFLLHLVRIRKAYRNVNSDWCLSCHFAYWKIKSIKHWHVVNKKNKWMSPSVSFELTYQLTCLILFVLTCLQHVN